MEEKRSLSDYLFLGTMGLGLGIGFVDGYTTTKGCPLENIPEISYFVLPLLGVLNGINVVREEILKMHPFLGGPKKLEDKIYMGIAQGAGTGTGGVAMVAGYALSYTIGQVLGNLS
ncbi:MAG: hypothetical protein H6500_00820 [Candidatus Woesearchaeota archaeon]|nr:hypothetical protein [Nanoarchaeota archaeon]USN44375.1 MAG: hypothetical protein H6500_00820 [Candidatus Woesearchaeota archaeon]